MNYQLPGAAYSDLQEGSDPKGVLEDRAIGKRKELENKLKTRSLKLKTRRQTL